MPHSVVRSIDFRYNPIGYTVSGTIVFTINPP